MSDLEKTSKSDGDVKQAFKTIVVSRSSDWGKAQSILNDVGSHTTV